MKKRLFITLAVTLLTICTATSQICLRQGSSAYSTILFNWDGQNLRQGSSSYSQVIANWDGQNIRRGSSKYSKVLYNWDGQYLRQGKSA